MLVYDVWCSDKWFSLLGEEWKTVYSVSLEELVSVVEERWPGSDWIIIENELPF